METVIQPTADEASAITARMVARQIRDKPDAVLDLAYDPCDRWGCANKPDRQRLG